MKALPVSKRHGLSSSGTKTTSLAFFSKVIASALHLKKKDHVLLKLVVVLLILWYVNKFLSLNIKHSLVFNENHFSINCLLLFL